MSLETLILAKLGEAAEAFRNAGIKQQEASEAVREYLNMDQKLKLPTPPCKGCGADDTELCVCDVKREHE